MVRHETRASGAEQSADGRETVLCVAAAIRFDRTTPLLSPFRVGYLPPH